MKNYKININREPLSADDLKAGHDFNRLLKTYKAVKPPLFKTVKFWFGSSAVLVASIAAIIIFSQTAGSGDGKTNPPFINPPFINPPIAQANVPVTKYMVNATTDSTLTYNTGTRIHIPANAFLDEAGKVVTGQVELSYREFHDAVDVLVAGIPMTYDSAGQQYHFETAGMMEIGATQNGKNLHVNPEAMINVDIASHTPEDRFNTYYLDTAGKKWQYINRPNLVAVSLQDSSTSGTLPAPPPPIAKPAERLAVEKAQMEVAQLKKEKPVAPAKMDAKKQRFSIKVDEREFPELAPYANLKFQPVDEKKYDPKKAAISWENVELKRIAGTANYEIVFSNASETYSVVASPAIEEKDYGNAKKIFDAKYKEYEAKLAEKKAEEARLQADLELKAKEIEARINKEMEEREARMREYEARLSQTNLVYRSLQVAEFGFWNCDSPNMLPTGAQVTAMCVDAATGKELQIQACYLVEKGRNAVFTYNGNNNKIENFKFNPDQENLVWAVTTQQRVAIIKADDFKAAAKTKGEVNLKLQVIEKKFASTTEVRQYLEI